MIAPLPEPDAHTPGSVHDPDRNDPRPGSDQLPGQNEVPESGTSVEHHESPPQEIGESG